jgi:hypothetical protein
VIDDRADGTARVGATSQTSISLLSFYFSPRWALVGATPFLTFLPLITLNPPPTRPLARLQVHFFPESKNLPAPVLEEGESNFFKAAATAEMPASLQVSGEPIWKGWTWPQPAFGRLTSTSRI